MKLVRPTLPFVEAAAVFAAAFFDEEASLAPPFVAMHMLPVRLPPLPTIDGEGEQVAPSE